MLIKLEGNNMNLIEQYIQYKLDYYNGTPSVSDSEFDALEETIRKKDPNEPALRMVGATVTGKHQVKHRNPMRSLVKANNIDDIERWIKNSIKNKTNQFTISDKLDGISCLLIYMKGKLQRAYSRGNGLIGLDITQNVKIIPNIPHTINNKQDYLEIRGEILLYKDCDIANPDDEMLRTVAGGILRRQSDTSEINKLKFIAYYMDTDADTISDRLYMLRSYGFEVPEYKTLDASEIEEYYNLYIYEYRAALNYEIDGLVITPDSIDLITALEDNNKHHPKWSIAFKFPNSNKESNLLDIKWQMSSHGILTPVAKINPVIINGSKIESPTLHNYERIIDMNITIGDELVIAKANDVIPKVVGNNNIDSGEPSIITDCPFCKTPITIIQKDISRIAYCMNDKCDEKNFKKITKWVTKTNMRSVADKTIKLLWDEKIISNVLDLFTLKSKRSEILNIKGMGDNKVDNIIKEIDRSRKITPAGLISKLGIYSVGKRALDKLNITTLKEFEQWKDDKYEIGKAIIEWKKDTYNMKYYNKLIKVHTFIQPVKPQEEIITKGHLACTGTGPIKRKDFIDKIKAMGYGFHSSIKKDTKILVCEDPNGNSTKLKSARSKGIKLISYDEILK